MAVILISIPLTILIGILFYIFTKVFKRVNSYMIFCAIVWAISVVVFYNGVTSHSIKELDNMSNAEMYYVLLYALTLIIPTVVLGCLFGVPALFAGYFISVKSKPVAKAPEVKAVVPKKKECKIFMTAKEERAQYDFTLLKKRN